MRRLQFQMGLMISRRGDYDHRSFEATAALYKAPLYVLLALLVLAMLALPYLLTNYFVPVAGSLGSGPVPLAWEGWNLMVGTMKLPLVPLAIAFLLLPVTVVAAMFVRFKKTDRVAEYTCGEKVEYSFSSFYFSTDHLLPWFRAAGLLFFISLLLAAIL